MKRQTKTDIVTIGGLAMGVLIWIAAVIALHGCYNPWDPVPERRGIPVADEQYVEGQNEALLRFQLDVEEEFGYHFGRLWEEVTVYWTDTLCGPNGEYGILWKDKCYAGLHFRCNEMYVAVSGLDETHVCKTALIHEYAHCLSNHMGAEHRRGNHDHSGPIWDLVPPAAQRACEGRR